MLLYFVRTGDAIKLGVEINIKKRIDAMENDSFHRIKLFHCIVRKQG
jgi:hypothetical protein